MGDKKLIIMAIVLVVAICAFVGYYMIAKKNAGTEEANGGTPTTATTPPPGGAPVGAPAGAPPGGMPAGAPAGGAPMAGTPPPAPMGTPPGAAPIAAAAPASTLPAIKLPAVPQIQPPKTANWKDIFAGGPPPPKKNNGKKVEKPAEIAVFEVPANAFTADKPAGRRGTTASGRTLDAPIGRHAGWIYSTNGQVVAIFEDSEGTARAIRVGDEIEGYRVKAIAQDALVLVDSTGREQRLKLQGMDTYQGKTTRNVAIDATPGTPAPPAWGTAP